MTLITESVPVGTRVGGVFEVTVRLSRKQGWRLKALKDACMKGKVRVL